MDLPAGADPLAAWDDFLARIGVPEEQRNSRSAIEDPDGQGPRVFFQQVPEDKVAKNRVHLDVRAAPGLQGDERMAALEAECERLVALGGTRLRRFEPAPPMSRRLHRAGRSRGQRVLPGLRRPGPVRGHRARGEAARDKRDCPPHAPHPSG